MKGIAPLFLGIFGTLAFSWAGLILIPNFQIGHLEPQVDEEGNDPYPAPKSGMVERGRQIYAANGCVYCHSQQVRGDYAASDLERTRDLGAAPKAKWGERRSAPRDYLFEHPVLLGKMRLGPDLANMGRGAPVEQVAPGTSPTPSGSPPASGSSPAGSAEKVAATTPAAAAPAPAPVSPAPNAAAPAGPSPNTVGPTSAEKGAPPVYSAAWHHRHLYSPRSLVLDSNMPAYRFLYEKRRISGERSADAVPVGNGDKVSAGWEVVPTYDAKCLVAYLMSLDQSHALQELKSAGAATAPAAPAAAAAPAKGAK